MPGRRFIPRTHKLSREKDYELNVVPALEVCDEAWPAYTLDEYGEPWDLIGWVIKSTANFRLAQKKNERMGY